MLVFLPLVNVLKYKCHFGQAYSCDVWCSFRLVTYIYCESDMFIYQIFKQSMYRLLKHCIVIFVLCANCILECCSCRLFVILMVVCYRVTFVFL